VRIRVVAGDDELGVLREIEAEAGEAFAHFGMPEVAAYEALPVADLRVYADAGRAWVAVDDDDRPIAYLIAEPVDGCLHIDQVSVRPSHARRGVGRSLIEYAADRATDYPALTLTTFTEVPWNGPYYVRRGFRYLADAEITPGLEKIRAHEAGLGLDRWPRACMRRDLR
jgi:GNAT superfamily N-acetyltransferase